MTATNTAFCQWFAKCLNYATCNTPHPVLGNVPTCDRCHRFATTPTKRDAMGVRNESGGDVADYTFIIN